MCVVRTKGELALRSDDPAGAARLAEEALRDRLGDTAGRGADVEPRGDRQLRDGRSRGGGERALDHCLAAEEAAGLDDVPREHPWQLRRDVAAARRPGRCGSAPTGGARTRLGRPGRRTPSRSRSWSPRGSHSRTERPPTRSDAVRCRRDPRPRGLFAVRRRRAAAAGVPRRPPARCSATADFERARAEGESTPVDQLADQTEAILRRRAAASSTTGG